jgi:hypothetical protein
MERKMEDPLESTLRRIEWLNKLLTIAVILEIIVLIVAL